MDDPDLILLRSEYDKKRKDLENDEKSIKENYRDKKEREKKLKEVHLPEVKMLEYVFCYDKITKNKNKTYAFVNSIGIRVCPYCNRNYIQVIEKGQEKQDSREFQTRPQLDHFWNKSMYPFLAISMSNLVPSCAVCNLAKHDKNNNILYPYKEGINESYRFSIMTLKSIAYMTKLKGCESVFGLQIAKNSYATSTGYDDRVQKSADTFGWDDTYKTDNEYALKVFQNSYIFNKDFQKSIVNAMPALFSSTEEVRSIINPKLVPVDKFNSEPLSKLTYDITEQARSDKEDKLDERIYELVLGIKKTKSINTKQLKIRSGAQSGVDRAALDFAKKHNIDICGWCPQSGWAEDYPEAPGVLDLYSELRETPNTEVLQQTLWNVRDSDAVLTIIPIGSAESLGTKLGIQEAKKLHKPCIIAYGVEDIPKIAEWIEALLAARNDVIELCVSGPRVSECAEAYKVTMEVLEGV